MPVDLVTIPFSHYCEKARWALERGSIRYTERTWAPVLHMLPALRTRRGGRTVPVLVTPHGAVQDSTDILRWVDAQLPEAKRLFPSDATAAEVERLEERFDHTLGPATRRWAYGHILNDRQRTLGLVARNIAPWQRTAFRLGLPAIRALMKTGMGINPAGVARSLARVREVFAEVDALLADGRPYLTGARFTAADLAFASLATPLTYPHEHERYLPSYSEVPPAARVEADALRESPAGRFALRMYRDERAKSA